METLFFTFLGLMMVSMLYVGTHMNTPMFWEEDGLIDKIKDKLGL